MAVVKIVNSNHTLHGPKGLKQRRRTGVRCEASLASSNHSVSQFRNRKVVSHCLEEKLRRQSAELRIAGERETRCKMELDSFVYAVTHDLMAPLRILLGFSGYLKSEYGSQLDETALGYVANMESSAKNLAALVTGLGTLAKQASMERKPTRVSLNEIVDSAVDDLRDVIEQRGCQIEVCQLPDVQCDPKQFKLLFLNLIENAIKFNDSEVPTVHIDASQNLGQTIISIRDNGIGISPKFHQAVFDVFRQLRRSASSAGIGMGLTLCRLIAQQNGGCIWIESNGVSGTTFFVAIPS